MTRFPGPLEPGWHHSGWHELLGWLLPMLFFIGFIALVVWAVIRLSGPGRQAGTMSGVLQPASRPDSALDQVRMRYAQGEITRDEFVQLMSDLGASPGELGPPPSQNR